MTLPIIIFVLAFAAARSRRVFPFLLIFAAGSEYLSDSGSMSSYPRLATAAAILGLLAWHRITWPPRLFVGRMLLAFAVWMCISVAWSPFLEATLTRVVTVVSLALLYLTVVLYVREPRDLDRFWSAFLIFASLDAATSLVNLRMGNIVIATEISTRTAGLAANPNDSALLSSLGLCVLLVGMLRMGQYKVWYSRPWISVALAVLLLGGILSSGSRSGALVGLAGCLTTLWFAWQIPAIRSQFLKKSWIAAGGAIVGLSVLMPQVIGLLARFDVTQEARFGGREEIFPLFVTEIPGHLFFGQGLNTVSSIGEMKSGSVLSTHNTYLTIILEFGMVGVILCGAIAMSIFRALASGRFGLNFFIFDRLLLIAFVIVNALFAMAADQVLNKFVWLFIGLIDAAHGLRSDQSMRELPRGPGWHDPRSNRARPT